MNTISCGGLVEVIKERRGRNGLMDIEKEEKRRI